MVLRSRLSFWQRMAYSWGSLGVLLVLALILGRGTWGLYQKNARAEERRDVALLELHEVEDRKQGLELELAHIKTTSGIEAELRHKFDVAREGEHLLVIVDKEVSQEPLPPTPSLWRNVRDFFRF